MLTNILENTLDNIDINYIVIGLIILASVCIYLLYKSLISHRK